MSDDQKILATLLLECVNKANRARVAVDELEAATLRLFDRATYFEALSRELENERELQEAFIAEQAAIERRAAQVECTCGAPHAATCRAAWPHRADRDELDGVTKGQGGRCG